MESIFALFAFMYMFPLNYMNYESKDHNFLFCFPVPTHSSENDYDSHIEKNKWIKYLNINLISKIRF